MTVRLKQLLLLLGDWALCYLALFFALAIRHQRWPLSGVWRQHWPIFTIVFLIWLAAFYLNGLYDLNRTKNNVAFFRSALTVTSLNLLLAIGFFYIFGATDLSPKTILVLLTLINLPFFVLWRFLTHRLLRTSTLKNRLLFLGLTPEAIELIRSFDKEPQIGYQTAAVLAEETNPHWSHLPLQIERLESFDYLLDFIKQKKIDTIVLALPATDHNLNHLLYQTILMRVNLTDIISFYEMITHRVPISALSEIWFLENLKEPQKGLYDLASHLINYFLAVLMLMLLIVFLMPVALIIYLYDRGPIFYHQTRIGKDGRIFTIYKFRTMIPEAESQGTQFTKKGDPRVTRIGKILRILHLDELPQSINILKGEMGFIGPRPERPEFVEQLQKTLPYYQARHLIKPGLTGWGQINYDYTDSLEGNLVKLQYDLYYIKNRSLLLDAVILLKTINIIVKGLGR